MRPHSAALFFYHHKARLASRFPGDENRESETERETPAAEGPALARKRALIHTPPNSCCQMSDGNAAHYCKRTAPAMSAVGIFSMHATEHT